MTKTYTDMRFLYCYVLLIAVLWLPAVQGQTRVAAAEVQSRASLSYQSADFCFASAVDNCELEGYAAQFHIENNRYLMFLSLGQLQSKTDTSKRQRLKVLYGELGVGVQHSLNPYLKLHGQVSFYSAGETEAGQTNSNSGLKTALVTTLGITSKLQLKSGVEYDASQNSSDFRDHDLRGNKPKMNFVRGSLGLKYQVHRYYSVVLQTDKIIKKASSRRTTAGDPGNNGSTSGFTYMLGLEKAF